MPDLETRKMLEEFAGWFLVQKDDKLESELMGSPPKLFLRGGVPHYESDPAAACSLLPKLMETISRTVSATEACGFSRKLMSAWAYHGEGGILLEPEEVAPRICKLIADAVRKVKDV